MSLSENLVETSTFSGQEIDLVSLSIKWWQRSKVLIGSLISISQIFIGCFTKLTWKYSIRKSTNVLWNFALKQIWEYDDKNANYYRGSMRVRIEIFRFKQVNK